LANPISNEMSVMRSTLWSGLIKTLKFNLARQQTRVRLFETGKRFIQSDGKIDQPMMVAGLASGPSLPAHWDTAKKMTDFYDIKGDVEAILGLTSCAGEFIFSAESHPALHPGQCAQIKRHNETIGWIGKLHPNVQKALGLTSDVFLFELVYAGLTQGRVPEFEQVSKFPSIRRDLALVIDEDIPAQQLCDQVTKTGKQRLKALEIFDVYRGKGVAEGKKSLAIGLTIQDDAQTLTDEDVDSLIADILDNLHKTIGATLRE
jgi:phenylalanyl-tRNA synthetase beta chain